MRYCCRRTKPDALRFDIDQRFEESGNKHHAHPRFTNLLNMWPCLNSALLADESVATRVSVQLKKRKGPSRSCLAGAWSPPDVANATTFPPVAMILLRL